jgi:hypothetical protein
VLQIAALQHSSLNNRLSKWDKRDFRARRVSVISIEKGRIKRSEGVKGFNVQNKLSQFR